jgi:Cu2+-exporting ATPase
VAETIAGQGLSAFYRSRTTYAPRGEGDARDDLAIYDRAEVQCDFVSADGALREATLLLEGITCAACVWLNETHLSRLPGVHSVEINYTTHRARVRWDPATVRLSEILRAVEAGSSLFRPVQQRRCDAQTLPAEQRCGVCSWRASA